LSLEEGKKILAEIQRQMVTTQMEQRAPADRCCANCGRSLRNKGTLSVDVPFDLWKCARASATRPTVPPLRALSRRSPVHAQILHLARASLLGCQTGRTGAVCQSG
jgi:hypothetical protein